MQVVLESMSKEQLISFALDSQKKINLLSIEKERWREQFLLLQQRVFARKAEEYKDDKAAQAWLFNEIETNIDPSKSEPIKVETILYTRRKKKGRRPLPQNLPTVEVEHKLEGKDRECKSCQQEMQIIGKREYEELEHIPAHYKVIKHKQYKYSCNQCATIDEDGKRDKVVEAPAAQKILPGTITTPSLLSSIITSKFCDALPFYRQEKIFKRAGINLARSTMCNWAIKLENKIAPLKKSLLEKILEDPVIHIDETTLQVLKEPGRDPSSNSYMWCIRSGPNIWYHYQPSRSTEFLQEVLKNYRGTVVTDGYSSYDTLAKLMHFKHAGCWAHVRRKFHEVTKLSKNENSTAKALNRIQQLYKIERRAREQGLTDVMLLEFRKKHSSPLINELYHFLIEQEKALVPDLAPHKAVKYTLKQWPKLILFLENANIPLDNNLVENAIRPFVIGRKNWLFSDTPKGARASAALYSLVQTAVLNGHEPFWYLNYLFEVWPRFVQKPIVNLLPSNLNRNLVAEYFKPKNLNSL